MFWRTALPRRAVAVVRVHDQPVKNLEALANPEALEFFRGRAELAD